MEPTREQFYVLPIVFEYDGATVYLLEIGKLATGDYLASVRVKWSDIESKTFQIVFKDRDDLKRKLSVEIAKLKMLAIATDRNTAMRVVTL